MSLSSSPLLSTTSPFTTITSSFTTFTSTSPSPTPTSPLPGVINDGGNGGSGQRGANYFFGFLITFVVLLLIFVGCGIGSRRRFLARRNAALSAGLDPWGAALRGGAAAQAKPRLYELYVGGTQRAEDKWAETTPLSLTLLRQRVEPPVVRPSTGPDSDLEAAAATLNANPNPNNPPPVADSAYARTLASLTVPFHERKQSLPTDTGAPPAYGAPAALDVAVVIAMPAAQYARPYSYAYSLAHPRAPSPTPGPDASEAHASPAHSPRASDASTSSASRARGDGAAAALPEVQIGVATLPWHRELDGAGPPPGS